MARDRWLRKKVEKKIGRKLKAHERIHHKDGNPENNEWRNLEILIPHEHNIVTFKGKNALYKFRRHEIGY